MIMREIKFRAWDKKSKKWLEPIYEAYNNKVYDPLINFGGRLLIRTMDGFEAINNQDQDIELMQYTGLKDKNGKGIYEGDIIKEHSSWDTSLNPAEVKFGDCGVNGEEYHVYGFYLNNNDKEILANPTCSMEVIGNIYENPKLLN